MITFNFYSISEKAPRHKEDIILLRYRTIFDSEGSEPIQTSVEYQWAIIDPDGDDTGSAYCYEECDPEGIDILENEVDSGFSIKLEMLCNDGFRLEPKDLWVSRTDYIESFEKVSKIENKNICDQKIDGSCPHHNLICKWPYCEEVI